MMRGQDKGFTKFFVIMAVVLVASALLVLYGLRQYQLHQQPAAVAPITSDMTKKPAENNKKADDTKTEKTNSGEAEKKSTEQTKENDKNTENTSTGDRDEAALADEKTDNTSSSSADVSLEALPQTGPADTLFGTLGVSLLAGLAIAYVRSRRAALTLS